jgi:hypothetical protein
MAVQLLAAGTAGLALGVISAILGMVELRHRARLPQADEPILAKPVRGRWS